MEKIKNKKIDMQRTTKALQGDYLSCKDTHKRKLLNEEFQAQ